MYEGPSAFSEPEIRVIRDAVYSNLERTALYISLHSYGNMFLYAWGTNGAFRLYLSFFSVSLLIPYYAAKADCLTQCFPTWGPRPTWRQFDI